jgi:hypothetical protein
VLSVLESSILWLIDKLINHRAPGVRTGVIELGKFKYLEKQRADMQNVQYTTETGRTQKKNRKIGFFPINYFVSIADEDENNPCIIC